MTTEIPLRVSLPVSPLPQRGSTAPRWSFGRVAAVVFGFWAAVAALLAAVVFVVVWDLRP
jgi:hypothetical protein